MAKKKKQQQGDEKSGRDSQSPSKMKGKGIITFIRSPFKGVEPMTDRQFYNFTRRMSKRGIIIQVVKCEG